VVLFTSGLDSLTNDSPLQPAFVPLIEQTARYLGGGERQGDARMVDAYLDRAMPAMIKDKARAWR